MTKLIVHKLRLVALVGLVDVLLVDAVLSLRQGVGFGLGSVMLLVLFTSVVVASLVLTLPRW